jgi:hypothetical protein
MNPILLDSEIYYLSIGILVVCLNSYSHLHII